MYAENIVISQITCDRKKEALVTQIVTLIEAPRYL